MMAGSLPGGAGGDASIVSGSPSTIRLTLTSGDRDKSGRAVTIDGRDGSMASGTADTTVVAIIVAALLLLGGPAPKLLFFQMTPKSFLSVLIHSTRCKYDFLDFFHFF